MTFSVEPGECVGYIGPNGAGKSTTIKMLTGILVPTHDLPDIERLCERILVIDHGRVAFDGTLPGLAARVGAERVLVVDLHEPAPALTDVPGTTLVSVEADGLRQHLAFRSEQTTAAEVVATVSARVPLRDLTVTEPDIEDVVRRLYTGGGHP